MLKLNRINQACAVALALVFPGAAMAADAPAGQLLFVSGRVTIVDAKGVERPAIKGGAIGPGERLVTGGGAIGQIKLSDGSLIGLRSDSDLKLDAMKPADGKGPAERVMFLSKGAVRVVNVDGDRQKHLPVLLQTPTATIGLRNADNESIVVPAAVVGGAKPAVDPGTYSRMAVGDGVIKTAGGETSLGTSQTGFAASGSATLPTKIAALPVLNPPVLPVVTPGVAGGSLPTGGIVPLVTGPIALGPSSTQLPPQLPNSFTAVSPTSRVITPIPPIILTPPKPPTLKGANLDITTATTKTLINLPPETLATLPQATLEKLPPATLATLPAATIKSLTPAVQGTVTPLLTPIQQTAVTTAVPAPINTTTLVPITTLKGVKF
jgi:hypothetical protein